MTDQRPSAPPEPQRGAGMMRRTFIHARDSLDAGAELFTQRQRIRRLQQVVVSDGRVPTTPQSHFDEGEAMVTHESIAEWRGKQIVDRDGDKIGKLEDVYVDFETDEPVFGTVKEGLIGRHLTFVPLGGVTIGPDSLRVPVSGADVKEAPELALDGQELSQADESTLYHHYKLNYTAPATESGRRLARR